MSWIWFTTGFSSKNRSSLSLIQLFCVVLIVWDIFQSYSSQMEVHIIILVITYKHIADKVDLINSLVEPVAPLREISQPTQGPIIYTPAPSISWRRYIL